MSLRFKLPPGGDVPAVTAARRLGLSEQQFAVDLPALLQAGFPPPDPITGNFMLEAIDAWRKDKRKLTGYVYFIQSGDFIKIGYSTNPAERLSGIRGSMPFEAELLLAYAANQREERRLHKKFRHLRHRNEWFTAHRQLLAHIAWLRDESIEILFQIKGTSR